MLNPDTKKSFLFSASLLIIIWILVGSFSWIINLKKKETAELMANISIKSSRKSEIEILDKNLQELKNKIERIDNFILPPGEEALVKFIENIERLGNAAGVVLTINSIEVVKKAPDAPVEDYEEIMLDITTKGDFKQVFHFANMIENLPYHFSIQKISLDKNTIKEEDEDEKSVWTGSFIFKVSKFVNP